MNRTEKLMVACRLQKMYRSNMWGSGLLKKGSPRERKAWMFQRVIETMARKCINPFLATTNGMVKQ